MHDPKVFKVYNGRRPDAIFQTFETPDELFGYVLELGWRSDVWVVGNDGSARCARVNGKIKRWKREPWRFELPLKYGLYEHFTITQDDYARVLVTCVTNNQPLLTGNAPALSDTNGPNGFEPTI